MNRQDKENEEIDRCIFAGGEYAPISEEDSLIKNSTMEVETFKDLLEAVVNVLAKKAAEEKTTECNETA